MATRLDVAKTELEALETRATTLKEEIANLQNGRGLEAEMRNRFDVAKSGEQVIVIVEEDGSNTASPNQETEPREQSLFSRLKWW